MQFLLQCNCVRKAEMDRRNQHRPRLGASLVLGNGPVAGKKMLFAQGFEILNIFLLIDRTSLALPATSSCSTLRHQEQRGGALHAVKAQRCWPVDRDLYIRRAALPRHDRAETPHVGLCCEPCGIVGGPQVAHNPGAVRSAYIQGE